jgi:hypothetical protein
MWRLGETEMAIWSWHPLHAPKRWFHLPAVPLRLRELWRTDRPLGLAVGIGILVVLFMFPTLATAFLLASLAALLGLILQAALKPSPLVWAVPWEAVELFLDRKARLNHAWKHHIQSLACELVESPGDPESYADAEGIFLFTDRLRKTQVQQLAQSAWDEMVQQADENPVHTCKTVQFFLTALLGVGAFLTLQVWRDVEFPFAILCIVVAIVAAGSLVAGAEKLLGRWMETRAWQEEKAETNLIQVEPMEIPKMFFFRGGQGFCVYRIATGMRTQNDKENERATQSIDEGTEPAPTIDVNNSENPTGSAGRERSNTKWRSTGVLNAE